eukprot:1706378-Amphidinium_carterae.1
MGLGGATGPMWGSQRITMLEICGLVGSRVVLASLPDSTGRSQASSPDATCATCRFTHLQYHIERR